MVFVYKTNITWTTPLVDYQPSSSWPQAVSSTNDTTASFKFRGTGVKWFGAANASYAVQLNTNGQPVGPQSRGTPRVYQPSAEVPSNVACTKPEPWGCVVLAEFYDLAADAEHEVVLTTVFEGDTAGNKIDLLAMQVHSNTTLPDQVITQSTTVRVDNSRLTFAGDWKGVTYDPDVYRISKTPGSTITLQFRGYALRIAGTTDITTSPFSVSLDGTTYNVSTPTSNSPDNNCLFWFIAGLDQSKEHTAVLTNTGTDGLIISRFDIDRLIDPANPADIGDDGFSTTASSPPGSTATPTKDDESKSSGLPGGAIAGIAVGVVALFVLIFALFWWRRTKRKRDTEMAQLTQPSPLISNNGSAIPLHPSQNQYPQNVNPYPIHLAVPNNLGNNGGGGAFNGGVGPFYDGQGRPSSSSLQNSNLLSNQQIDNSGSRGSFAIISGVAHHKPPLNQAFDTSSNSKSHDQNTISTNPSSPYHRPQPSQTGSSSYLSAYPTSNTSPNVNANAMSPTQTSVSGSQMSPSGDGSRNGDAATARSYTPPPAYEPQIGPSASRRSAQRPAAAEKSPSATASLGLTNS